MPEAKYTCKSLCFCCWGGSLGSSTEELWLRRKELLSCSWSGSGGRRLVVITLGVIAARSWLPPLISWKETLCACVWVVLCLEFVGFYIKTLSDLWDSSGNLLMFVLTLKGSPLCVYSWLVDVSHNNRLVWLCSCTTSILSIQLACLSWSFIEKGNIYCLNLCNFYC